MSRHNITRAQDVFQGSANLANYQGDKNGVQFHPFYRWRPTGVRAGTFSGALAAGVTSATLSGNWAGASGLYQMTLSSGQVLSALLANGATTCSFFPAGAPPTGGTFGSPQAVLNAVTSAFTVSGQPPVLGVANSYSVSAAVALGVAAVLGGTLAVTTYKDPLSGLIVTAGVPDVPRNVIGAWTGTAIVTVTGYDAYGQLQTEVSASGTALATKKAFAAILSIVPNANITGATFGTGNVLGLPFRVSSGDFFAPTVADLADTGTLVLPDLTQPATNATGDVRGTYVTNTALNGAKFVGALLKVTDTTTCVGTFGQTPA